MNSQRDAGVNEVIASILMVALVIVLAIVIGSIVFGVIVLQPKSAYIPPRVEVVNGTGGQQVISLYSRGGDPAVLNKGDGVQYALGIYVETPAGSSRATPDTGVATFGPGQTLYIYNSTAGFRATDNLTRLVNPTPLPSGPLTLRLVDENAKLLVYKEGMTIGAGGTGGPTVSPSPIPQCGTITGRVYNITDNSGLSGFIVQYRFRANQGNAPWSQWISVTTGIAGSYQFTNVIHNPAQDYEVGVIVPAGWVLVQPVSNYSFIMNPGDKCYATGRNFGLRKI